MSAEFANLFPPRRGRAHEAQGPGATAFAAIAAGQAGGPCLWIVEAWRAERLNPAGLAPFFNPANLLIAEAGGHTAQLAMAEEALRAKVVTTVVAELHAPLDLTAGRRLQLAAEAGNTLGLLVIPEGMGSNAAETRWHCVPEFGHGDSTRMRWEIIKNKSGTSGCWALRWDEQAHRIAVVSQAGK